MQSLSVFMRKCTTSKENHRRELSYAWKDKDGTIWASDGYRMHVDKLHPDYETVTDFDYEAYEGLRGLKIVDVNSDLKRYGAMAETLRTNDRVPPFESIVPAQQSMTHYTVYAEDFKNAVKRCQVMENDWRILKIQFLSDGIVCKSEHPEKGDCTVTLPAVSNPLPDGSEIALSSTYVFDAIMGLQHNDKITVHFRAPDYPILFGNRNERFVMIMPIFK